MEVKLRDSFLKAIPDKNPQGELDKPSDEGVKGSGRKAYSHLPHVRT